MIVLTCKREQHSNCEGGCQTKVFLLRRSLNTDLLAFFKLKFLRILDSSISFQEPVMTFHVVITLSEKEKNWIQVRCTYIYFNIYLCITDFLWFITSYTMREPCVLLKVRMSTKLRGLRRSPELFAMSTDFCVPETLISITQSTCGKGKFVLARF